MAESKLIVSSVRTTDRRLDQYSSARVCE